MLFLVKGTRLSVWGTKDVNSGGTGLTNVNFASIDAQASLRQLASTLDEVEKMQVEKLTCQFLDQHSYFSRTWKTLSDSLKRQVLNIIVSGKGVIQYE